MLAYTAPFNLTVSRAVHELEILNSEQPSGQRAFEVVAAHIRLCIANGELKADQRLATERELASEFGVSRNTVREALRSLEIAGVVSLKRGPGGGAFIASKDHGAIRNGLSDLLSLGLVGPEHLMEARIVLGVAVARFAAMRRNYSDLELLQNNIANISRSIEANDGETRGELSHEFHRLLARATHNPALEILNDAVLDLNRSLTRLVGLRDPKLGVRFRAKIFSLIEAKDAHGASQVMETHLEDMRRFHQRALNP